MANIVQLLQQRQPAVLTRNVHVLAGRGGQDYSIEMVPIHVSVGGRANINSKAI